MNANRGYPLYRMWIAFAAMLLTIGMLAGCGKGGGQTEVTTEPTETEAQTETPAITEETETLAITTEAPVTEPVTEAITESPVLEDDGEAVLPVIHPEDAYIDPLTGLVSTENIALRRPVAIMINNITAALPQQQIGAASVVYECEVEGGLTRLLGVYNDYSALEAIGSVRSAREYYLDFAANHDAIYVHAGGSDTAYNHLASRSTAHIDGVNGGAVTSCFYRDPDRAYMPYEHRLVIDGEGIDKAIGMKKYRTTYKASFESPLHFVGPEQTVVLANGTAANEVTVKFGYHQTHFTYDAETNTYLRFQNGNAHIDGVTDEQLAYENVLILFCTYGRTNDELHHITVNDVGKGKGYYLTGGKYVEINWSKASADSAVKLTYPSGREVYLTPGKTNIEIVSGADRVTVEK